MMIHCMKSYHEKYVEALKKKLDKVLEGGISPELWILTDGKHPECDSYMRSKLKWAETVGVKVHVKVLDNLEELKSTIDYAEWNKIPVILQLPCDQEYVDYYNHRKTSVDVDGFFTFQDIVDKDYRVIPATPKGVLRFIKSEDGLNLNLRGKNVVIVGRGLLVGYPLTMLMLNEGATVATINTKTNIFTRKNLLKDADVVILATGVKGSVSDYELGNKEVYVINVGTVFEEGKLTTELQVTEDRDNITYTDRIGAIGVSTVLSLLDNVINYYTEGLDVWK